MDFPNFSKGQVLLLGPQISEDNPFLYTCAVRGLEDGALILVATWYRQGPAMTQQFNVNHGHPDGDLMTSILAYEWYLECKKAYTSKYDDWQVQFDEHSSFTTFERASDARGT